MKPTFHLSGFTKTSNQQNSNLRRPVKHNPKHSMHGIFTYIYTIQILIDHTLSGRERYMENVYLYIWIFNKQTLENRILFNMLHNLHDSQTVVICFNPKLQLTRTSTCCNVWGNDAAWNFQRNSTCRSLNVREQYRINMIWWLHIPLSCWNISLHQLLKLMGFKCIPKLSIHGAFEYIMY